MPDDTSPTEEFPKIHLLLHHAYNDIQEKGSTLGYSTKPFEKMHGSIHGIYQHQPNFRDVDKQVFEFMSVWTCIDIFDRFFVLPVAKKW